MQSRSTVHNTIRSSSVVSVRGWRFAAFLVIAAVSFLMFIGESFFPASFAEAASDQHKSGRNDIDQHQVPPNRGERPRPSSSASQDDEDFADGPTLAPGIGTSTTSDRMPEIAPERTGAPDKMHAHNEDGGSGSFNKKVDHGKITLMGGVNCFDVLTAGVQARAGIVCAKDSSGVTITEVNPQSEAYFKGLRRGDVVLDAQRIGADQFAITISRDGHTYQATLGESLRLRPMQAESGKFEPVSPSDFSLNATRVNTARLNGSVVDTRTYSDPMTGFAVNQNQLRILSDYNLELIIDRSLSMRQRDCQGGLSRWDWCGYQAAAISRALATYVPSGVTISRFAGTYDVHEHSSPQTVEAILTQHDFQRGTRLSEPLADRLNNYLAFHKQGDKPLLVVVITDGCPWPYPEPLMVIDVLVRASQRMTSPGEVTVAFLQVGGNDPMGRNYLLNLGNNLVSGGARYQFVRTTPFEELERVGLAQAIVNSVRRAEYPRQVN